MTITFEALVCNGSLHSTSKLEAVSYSGSILCLDTRGSRSKHKEWDSPAVTFSSFHSHQGQNQPHTLKFSQQREELSLLDEERRRKQRSGPGVWKTIFAVAVAQRNWATPRAKHIGALQKSGLGILSESWPLLHLCQGLRGHSLNTIDHKSDVVDWAALPLIWPIIYDHSADFPLW